MTYRDLNRRTRLVLATIWASGLTCILLTALRPYGGGTLSRFAIPLAVFIILTTVAELFPVSFELGRYEITVSTVFLVGSILVFRQVPQFAVLTALVAALTANVLARKPWFKVCTNVALAVTAVTLSSIAFGLIGASNLPHLVAATIALLLVYFVMDTVPMTWLLSAIESRPFRVTYVNNYQGVVLEHFGIEVFGVLLAVIWSVSPWLTPLLVLPIVIMHQAYFQAERLRTESITALEAMADLIENRDVYTHDHTESVSAWSRRLAERMGLDAREVWKVAVAGRLHDLGKVAVSDSILLKPGKLTVDEMRQMHEHCRVGYDVLARFSNLQGVARLIRAHHERYDGGGYPDRLAGNDIPLGAAIIAIADAFDAMTTNRPYRKGMPVQAALDILRQGLGRQWHPIAGATFMELVLEDEAKKPARPEDPHEIRGLAS
ncbi:MAG TPA: HD domain-containing phosphohydrolase [Candidatus Dormibacteraeota bacterium]